MTNAVKLIIDLLHNIFNVVNDKLSFELFGQQVHLFSLALALIILVMIFSIFWKGVRG